MNTASPSPFPNIPAASSTLGKGLWGEVLDLNNGTVLKLSRRKCAGIGDGLLKLQREVDVLRAIELINKPSQTFVAKVKGWGQQTPKSQQPNDDRELWLHITKVPGHTKTTAALESLSTKEKEAVATSIILALTSLHTLLNQAVLNQVGQTLDLPDTEENLQSLKRQTKNDAEGQQRIEHLQKQLQTIEDRPNTVIHGDFNLSNLLFEDNTVTAIVDFAETRKGFYEEDLAALISEIPSYQTLLLKKFETVTGHTINHHKLNYALALKSLLTFLIARRQLSSS